MLAHSVIGSTSATVLASVSESEVSFRDGTCGSVEPVWLALSQAQTQPQARHVAGRSGPFAIATLPSRVWEALLESRVF